MDMQANTIQLARDGVVNCDNYRRLGLDRVIRGAYAETPHVAEQDEWALRRARWLNKVRAVIAAYADMGVALHGVTALQVMSVALPERLQDWDVVHIVVKDAGRRPRRAGVTAHCASRPFKVWKTFDGLPVLHPVDHWLQLRGATVNELVEVGDGFVRRKSPLLPLAELGNRLHELSGLRGVDKARRALNLVRAETDSLYETRTRLVLVDAKLPTPVVNLPVRCPSVRRTYHVDMGYKDARVAVEYDGLGHVGDRVQMEIDAERRRNLQDEDWMVISVTAEQLRHHRDLVRSVDTALVLRTGRWG